jgi:hypothetical protein
MKRYTLFMCCVLVLFVALLLASQSVIAQTGGDYDLSWNTLASGGATVGGIGDPVYKMDSAIGQPSAGVVAGIGGSGGYTLCAGYLCGVNAETRVYLPLVRK